MTTTTTHDEPLRQRLIAAGPKLPRALRDEVLAAGEAAVPALIAVLDDDELSLTTAPGEGEAPIHAASLLADLRAPAAIEPMLRALVRTEVLSVLHETLGSRLREFGAAALEPALRLYAESTDEEARRSLRDVMAGLGARDERVLRLLLDALADEPERGAMDLAEYGDPAALPALMRAFETCKPAREEGLFAGQTLIEIAAAIEDLGGELAGPMRQRLDAVRAKRRLAAGALNRAAGVAQARSAKQKVGRNDPCPCGSGTKFKKCCGR